MCNDNLAPDVQTLEFALQRRNHYPADKYCGKQLVIRWIAACVAWRFWLGALCNKGGRGQRNCEEIGAVRGFATHGPGSTKPPCYAGYWIEIYGIDSNIHCDPFNNWALETRIASSSSQRKNSPKIVLAISITDEPGSSSSAVFWFFTVCVPNVVLWVSCMLVSLV